MNIVRRFFGSKKRSTFQEEGFTSLENETKDEMEKPLLKVKQYRKKRKIGTSGKQSSEPMKKQKSFFGSLGLRIKAFTDMTKQHMRLYKKWRNAEMLASYMSVLALLFAILEYEYAFSYHFEHRDQLNHTRNCLRIIVCSLSFLSLLIIVFRYCVKIKWSNLPIPKQTMNLHYNNDYTNLMRRNREKGLITTKFINQRHDLGLNFSLF